MRQILKKATEHPCLKRAATKAFALVFEIQVRNEGHRSNRRNIIGPVAIPKRNVQRMINTEIQMTYPLKAESNEYGKEVAKSNFCLFFLKIGTLIEIFTLSRVKMIPI